MPQTLVCPPKANNVEPSDIRSCQEVKHCADSDSPTESSPSSSLHTSGKTSTCSSSYSQPSPTRSPSKWSSSSNGSPTFIERLRSASRLIPKSPRRARLTASVTTCTDDSDRVKVEPIAKPNTHCDGFRSFFREHYIVSELKLLSKNHQGGVYIMPSLNNLQVWHGIIFLRAGPYRDGIFRFFVFLPDDFPDSRPLLKFTTQVFHPQVHQNGVLNLDVAFPKWQKEIHSVWQIIRYMKSCFYYADTWGATNKAATNVIHNSLEEFKKKVQECVVQSQRLYDSEMDSEFSVDDGNHLKVKKMSAKEFEEGRQMMLQGALVAQKVVSAIKRISPI